MQLRISMFSALLMTLVAISPVSASAPFWEAITVDETFYLPRTSEACGFDVYERDTGSVKMQAITLGDGTQRFMDVAVRVDVTIFAPSQGTSVTLGAGGRGGAAFLIRPDGAVLEFPHGTNGHITVPGEGVVYMWAGNIRFTIDADGNVSEQSHGFIMDDFSGACAYLQADPVPFAG